MPNGEFPGEIESDCDGSLMFAAENDPLCPGLCETSAGGRRSTMIGRRGWTKWTK